MSFEQKGVFYKIFDSEKITDSFTKREFVLQVQDGAYEQLIKFQLTQDACDLLDNFSEGEAVTVNFNLRGREYIKGGEAMYFTNLQAWRITSDQPEQTDPPLNEPVNAGESDSDVKTDDLPF